MSDPADILTFDRAALRRHRERAAGLDPAARFLHRAVQERLIDRLFDIRRSFADVLDLGAGDGSLPGLLAQNGIRPARLIALDPSLRFARRSLDAGIPAVVAEEEMLPFRAGSFDLAIAALGLHWVNDLPGMLLQIRHILRPDGLFLAGMFGGRTLAELREVLMQAELDVSGGVSPRVSPFADLPDCGALLQRAGFGLPVVDSEMLTVTYPHLFALMADLRAMGETNALRLRPRGPARRALFLRAAELYRERYGDAEGRIPASFQLLTLTGWAPAANQQQPLRPGSAVHRLAEVLKGEEHSAGEAAPLHRPRR